MNTHEWIENNSAIILDIYAPLKESELKLMEENDSIFHEAIRENTKSLLYSMVCIEYNRCTGVSMEEFYADIDIDNLYIFVIQLEEFNGV